LWGDWEEAGGGIGGVEGEGRAVRLSGAPLPTSPQIKTIWGEEKD
jgi:hypothetical protein